jgi:hypothetical protein
MKIVREYKYGVSNVVIHCSNECFLNVLVIVEPASQNQFGATNKTPKTLL